MNTFRFLRAARWPMKSASESGRTDLSGSSGRLSALSVYIRVLLSFMGCLDWMRQSGLAYLPRLTERLNQHTPPLQVADRDAPVRPVLCPHTTAHHLSGNLLSPDGKAGG